METHCIQRGASNDHEGSRTGRSLRVQQANHVQQPEKDCWAQWIYTVLPAGGVALQTSFLYSLVDFAFWNIGNLAIWTPYVMLGAYCVEIPLFLCLAVYSYCTRKA